MCTTTSLSGGMSGAREEGDHECDDEDEGEAEGFGHDESGGREVGCPSPAREGNVSCESSTTALLGLGCPVYYEKKAIPAFCPPPLCAGYP